MLLKLSSLFAVASGVATTGLKKVPDQNAPGYGLGPLTLLFACEFAWSPCCHEVYNVARIALKDVKSKNGRYVKFLENTHPKLGESLDEDLILYDPLADGSYGAGKTMIDHDVTFYPYWSGTAGVTAAYFKPLWSKPDFETNGAKHPAIAYGAGSPMFALNPTLYPNYFHLASTDFALYDTVMKIMMQKFKWYNIVVVYDNGLTAQSHSTGLKYYHNKHFPMSEGGPDSDAASKAYNTYTVNPTEAGFLQAARWLQKQEKRVVFYIWNAEDNVKHFYTALAEAGLAGSAASARGWVHFTYWLGNAGSSWTTNAAGVIGFNRQHEVPEIKEKFYGNWAEDSQEQFTVHDSAGQWEYYPLDRRASPRASCDTMGTFGFAYDMVVTAALAQERRLKQAEKIFNKPGYNAATSTEEVDAVYDKLLEGFDFEGMSRQVKLTKHDLYTEAGASWPWNPRVSGMAIQVTQVAPDGTVKNIGPELYPDNAIEIFQQGGDLIYPGYTEPAGDFIPSDIAAGPCYLKDVRCLNGVCTDFPSTGREAGHCVCDSMWTGPLCDIYTISMSMSPLATSQEARSPVDVGMQIMEFSDYAVDGSTVDVVIGVNQVYEDKRVMLSDGKYSIILARQFEDQGLLWIPKITVPSCSDADPTVINPDDYIEIKYPNVKVVTTVRARGCLITTVWRWFPYDTQRPEITVRLENGIDTMWRENKSLSGSYKNSKGTTIVGIATSASSRWMPTWELIDSSVKTESTQIMLTFSIARDSTILILRILVIVYLLMMMSWSGYIISPENVDARLTATFVSFLSVTSIKTAAISEVPQIANITEVSWLDLVTVFVVISVSLAAGNVIYALMLMEKYGRLLTKEMDRLSLYVCSFFQAIYILFAHLMAGEDNLLGASYDFVQIWTILCVVVPYSIVALWIFLIKSNGEELLLTICIIKKHFNPALDFPMSTEGVAFLYNVWNNRYGEELGHELLAAMRMEKRKTVKFLPVKRFIQEVCMKLGGGEKMSSIVGVTIPDLPKSPQELGELVEILGALVDENGDGYITQEEFRDGIEKVVNYFAYSYDVKARRGVCAEYIYYLQRSIQRLIGKGSAPHSPSSTTKVQAAKGITV